jgi:hypothetical protein
LEDIRQWKVREHQDTVCIKIVVKLPGSDEYTVKNFLDHWVANLRVREDFADEVDWSLDSKKVAFLLTFHHDCLADDVSSHGDIE